MRTNEELRQILATVQAWVSAADQKAAALLTIAGVLVAFPAPSILVPSAPGSVPLLAVVCAAISAAAFVWSICGALLVLFPRTTNRTDTWSLTYFGDIAAMSQHAYAQAIAAADDVRMRDDLTAQIHINAQIASAKHRFFKHSIVALIMGIVFLVGAYVLIAVAATHSAKSSLDIGSVLH